MRFSAAGTLLATTEAMVSDAPAGQFSEELDNLLHVGTQDALRKLVQERKLTRHKLAGRFLYCAAERTRRRTPTHGKKTPAVIAAIEQAMQHDVAGDPITGIRWTRRTTEKLSAELAAGAIHICPRTVARILRDLDYRLRVNHKRVSHGSGADRDEQFTYIASVSALCRLWLMSSASIRFATSTAAARVQDDVGRDDAV